MLQSDNRNPVSLDIQAEQNLARQRTDRGRQTPGEEGRDTNRMPPLRVCVNVVGHAVAHLVLADFPPYLGDSDLEYITVEPENDFLGYVQMDLWPDVEDSFQWERMKIIEAMAGPLAEEYYLRHGLLTPLNNGPIFIEQMLAGIHDAEPDMRDIRQMAKWLRLDDPRAELIRLWGATGALLSSEWLGIVRVARVLREQRSRKGDEFEKVWRAGRPTLGMRRRLEARRNFPESLEDIVVDYA